MRVLPRLAVLAVLAGGVLVSGAAPASPAQAGPAPVAGYVWGNQPANPGYLAQTGYEYNSAGGEIRIVRNLPGNYHVTFEGMAGARGVAHASAYGNSHHCTVNAFGPRGDDLFVHVRCFDPTGAPADSPFVANVTNHQPVGVSFGYLHSDRPVPPPGGYTPTTSYDSTGAPVVVERLGVGSYRVELEAFGQDSPGPWAEGFLTVTPHAGLARHCQVLDPDIVPDPTQLRVNCYDHTGFGVDTGFLVTYARGVSPLGTAAPHASATINALAGSPIVQGWSNTFGGGATVTELGVGSYLTRFRVTSVPGGQAVGSIMGTPPMYCNINSWWTDGEHQYVWVRCYQNGAPHPAMLHNLGFFVE